MNFLTTQKKLAKHIGYTETHLSLFKHRKDDGHSEKFVGALSEATGIPYRTLLTASPSKLKRLFKEFLAEQKVLDRINRRATQ